MSKLKTVTAAPWEGRHFLSSVNGSKEGAWDCEACRCTTSWPPSDTFHPWAWMPWSFTGPDPYLYLMPPLLRKTTFIYRGKFTKYRKAAEKKIQKWSEVPLLRNKPRQYFGACTASLFTQIQLFFKTKIILYMLLCNLLFCLCMSSLSLTISLTFSVTVKHSSICVQCNLISPILLVSASLGMSFYIHLWGFPLVKLQNHWLNIYVYF